MGLGPFDLTAGPFLALYGVVMAATVIAGGLIPSWLRPEGRPGRVAGQDQLAYLAGGKVRLAEAAVTRLLASGAMAVADKTRLRIRDRGQGDSPIERALLAISSPASWKEVTMATTDHAAVLERELIGKGLLMDTAMRWQMRMWQTLPYLLAVAFGWIKIEVGEMREKPVEYLTAMTVAMAVFGLMRLLTLEKRTRAGIDAVAEARQRTQRASRAPLTAEAGMAVALYGTVALAGSPLSDFHELRKNNGDGGGDGGGSDGGGCGGCGGCGG